MVLHLSSVLKSISLYRSIFDREMALTIASYLISILLLLFSILFYMFQQRHSRDGADFNIFFFTFSRYSSRLYLFYEIIYVQKIPSNYYTQYNNIYICAILKRLLLYFYIYVYFGIAFENFNTIATFLRKDEKMRGERKKT